jgi:hypothetical protein
LEEYAIEERLTRIASKLATVPYRPDRGRSIAEKHASYRGFDLNPPLALDEAEAFEDQHQVSLPDPYRRFITEISDGGPGPSSGLLPLSDWYLGVVELEPGILQQPSPIEPDREHDKNWLDAAYDSDYDPCRGAVTIAHWGCSNYTFLIVSGPARGRLAHVNIDGWGWPYVYEDPDFLSWYERWLDEMAAGYELSGFGLNIPGDQNDLLLIIGSDRVAARRARAAWSLMCLPGFDPEGTPALIASLQNDPSSSVRTQIWHAAGQLGLEAVGPLGADALRDTEPGVRNAALRALDKLSHPNLGEIVRPVLTDPDADVQFTAYRIAAELGVLRISDLTTLLASDDAKKRRTAVYHLRHVADPGREELLHTALTDEDQYVRIYAVQSIAALEAVNLLPALKRMLSTEADQIVRTNLHRTINELDPAGLPEK